MKKLIFLIALSFNLMACSTLQNIQEKMNERRMSFDKEARLKYLAEVEKNMFFIDEYDHGGVLRAMMFEQEVLEKKLSEYCNHAYSTPTFKVTRNRLVTEYVGNKGGGYTSCSDYGCYSSSNSSPQYVASREFTFECQNAN